MQYNRLTSGCTAHFADGTYNLDAKKGIYSSMTLIGQSAQNTIIKFNGIAFNVGTGYTLTLKDLDDITISLENLAELYQTISKENPWSKCAPKSLLPADLREIEQLINDTLHALDDFLVERGRVYDIYGIKKPETLNEFEKSLSAFDIISSKNSELIDGDILKSGAWNNNLSLIHI